MTNTEKKSHFSLMAAIIYAAIAVYNIINRIIYANSTEVVSITAFNIVYWIVLIGLAVTLFMKNKKAVAFAAGVNALLYVYHLVVGVRSWTFFSMSNFCTYAVFVVIIVMAIRGNTVVKKTWFLAGTILLVGSMICWIQYGRFEFIAYYWESLLVTIAEIVALAFAGMWLKDDITTVAVAPVNEYATFNPQGYSSTISSNDAIGGADKLMMYKELLDSGTITQEEFNVKKKQILGL